MGADINAELAQDIAQRLGAAIAARGFAVLSVSGGKSPIALFEALRRQPLDWSRVYVTLVDERCVPCTHPDSNALLVRTHLLQDQARAARFVPMVEETAEPPLAPPAVLAQAASVALQAAGRTDVLVLGMGADATRRRCSPTRSIWPTRWTCTTRRPASPLNWQIRPPTRLLRA